MKMKEIIFEWEMVKDLFDRYLDSPDEWGEDVIQSMKTLARHIEELM